MRNAWWRGLAGLASGTSSQRVRMERSRRLAPSPAAQGRMVSEPLDHRPSGSGQPCCSKTSWREQLRAQP